VIIWISLSVREGVVGIRLEGEIARNTAIMCVVRCVLDGWADLLYVPYVANNECTQYLYPSICLALSTRTDVIKCEVPSPPIMNALVVGTRRYHPLRRAAPPSVLLFLRPTSARVCRVACSP
jgi:hypothetical protein